MSESSLEWIYCFLGPISRVVTLCCGFLMLFGAEFAFGYASGQFISGWNHLSLSVVPFTITMFLSGMLVAKLMCPKNVNKGKKI